MAVALALGAAGVAWPAHAAPPRFLAAWGSQGTAPGQFDTPDGVAVDLRGHVYVVDRGNHRVQKLTGDGRPIAVWGRPDRTPGSAPGEFNEPYSVAVDGYGDVYVLDTRNDRLQKFTPGGRFLHAWGRTGSAPGELADARGIEVDRRGVVYVSDHGNHRIQAFTLDGRLRSVWGRNGGDGSAGSGPGEFDQPRSAATDRAGNVYVVEKRNHRVQKLRPDGTVVARWGKNGGAGGGDAAIGTGDGEFNLPYDAAVDSRDRVYVVDTSNTRVQRFHPGGTFLDEWGGPGVGPGQFHDPYQVAIDCRDNVYVTDEDNSRVQKFGDPGAPPARCPPALRLGRPEWSRSRRAVVVRARCDQPCTVGADASVGLAGESRSLRPVRVEMVAEAPATLVLRAPRATADAVRRSLREGGAVVRVRARAAGFGGRSGRRDRVARLGD